MLRIVVAEPGPDGQDRTTAVLARALRDAGHEVIYAGPQTAEQVVQTAIQEDADLVGLAVPSDGQVDVFAQVIALLRDRDAADVVVFGSGTVAAHDAEALADLGVARVFPPVATAGEITAWVAAQFPGA